MEFTPPRLQVEEILIFTHIPKSAGSSTWALINRLFGKERVFRLGKGAVNKVESGDWLSNVDFEHIKVIGGHVGFGLHRWIPKPTRYFCILRDPIEHVISFYYAFHYKGDDAAAKIPGLAGFNAYLQGKMPDNIQTRYLSSKDVDWRISPKCTEEMFLQAKENAKKYYLVVGILERYAETIHLLRSALGANTSLLQTRKHVNKIRPKKAELPTETLDLIQAKTQFDTALHQFAQELMDEQVSAQGPGFMKKVRNYKRRVKAYSAIAPLFRPVATTYKKMRAGKLGNKK